MKTRLSTQSVGVFREVVSRFTIRLYSIFSILDGSRPMILMKRSLTRREAGSSCRHSPRVHFDSNSIRACPFRSLFVRYPLVYFNSCSSSYSPSPLHFPLREICVCVRACSVVWRLWRRGRRREEEQAGSRRLRVLRIIAISRPFWFRIADVPRVVYRSAARIPFLQRSGIITLEFVTLNRNYCSLECAAGNFNLSLSSRGRPVLSARLIEETS